MPIRALIIFRGAGDWATRTFTASKVRETYGANNWVVTPHDDREAGRPSRVSTVYSELVSNGAITHNANGWETPQWFNTGGDHTDEPYQPSFYRTNWHGVQSGLDRLDALQS